MIFYPIQTLVNAGITDIMIITGGNHAGDFLPLLGNGHEFGLKRLHFTYQAREGGIAEALSLTQDFVGDDRVIVILGDNIFEKNINQYVENFRKQEKGAKILLKEVEHPEQYGVPEFDDNGKIVRIIENPKAPAITFSGYGSVYV